jgi:hypothetical protein
MWNWLNTNAGVLSLILAVVLTLGPLIFSALRYIKLRSDELRFKRFEIYHRLVQQLVAPEPGSDVVYLDRQIAVVYELRNFPEYYEVSIRVLRGLQGSWAATGTSHQRLLEEMEYSIEYMNGKLEPNKRIKLSKVNHNRQIEGKASALKIKS